MTNIGTTQKLSLAALLAFTIGAAPAYAQRAVPRSGEWRQGGGASGEERRPSDEGRGWTAPADANRERERAPRDEQRAPAEQPQAQPAERSQPRSADQSSPPTSSPRTRGDGPAVGSAIPRDERPRPPQRGGNVIVIPGGYGGYYPWGYGGLGFGGYYDPWYGGYPAGYYDRRADGRLRLKIKPREASVYVDGYYAGRVDDFDGIFQRLPLEPGPYRIEVRADGYMPMSFDVRILPDRTLTYEAALEPAP